MNDNEAIDWWMGGWNGIGIGQHGVKRFHHAWVELEWNNSSPKLCESTTDRLLTNYLVLQLQRPWSLIDCLYGHGNDRLSYPRYLPPSLPPYLPTSLPPNLIHLFVLCTLCDCDDNQPHQKISRCLHFPTCSGNQSHHSISSRFQSKVIYDVWCYPEKSCHSPTMALYPTELIQEAVLPFSVLLSLNTA